MVFVELLCFLVCVKTTGFGFDRGFVRPLSGFYTPPPPPPILAEESVLPPTV